MMLRTLVLLLWGLALSAQAAEPIEGLWKTESGETVSIQPCGAGYCLAPVTGKHKGMALGSMTRNNDKGAAVYHGHVTNPADGKVYEGSAKVSGTALTLKGCVMEVICQAQHWVRE